MPSKYKYNTPPVPTVYKDRQYRSRLEAKWAAFFDLVGWEYEYEPCDLNGWFPDFALYGKNRDGRNTTILCEVKPIVEFDESTAERMRNALAGTYYQNSELLLLGSGPIKDEKENRLQLGWLYEQPHGPWDAAMFHAYGVRRGATLTYIYGFAHKSGSFADRITGHYQEGRQIAPEDCGLESLSTLWQQSGNITQYKPPETPQPTETPQPAPDPAVPPLVTTSDKKPPVNPEGPLKTKKKAGIWIVSGVFIAAVIICGLLLTQKQSPLISTPLPTSSDQNADRITALERENSRLKADRIAALERENDRLKQEKKQPTAMVDTLDRASGEDATEQPPKQSPSSSTPTETSPSFGERQAAAKQSPPSSTRTATSQPRAKRDQGPPPRTETWRGLTVAPEQRCTPYNRRDYPYPSSLELRIVETLGNRIYSPYTKQVFMDLQQTNIDHIVAMSEAHDSGLCAAPDSTRRAFASDLLNLTLASPEVNRCNPGGKCANDAAEWLPQQNQCWFAGRVVEVRRKYHLTIDRREADALDRVLAACPSTAMIGPEDDFAVGTPPDETPPELPEDDPLTLWDDNGNGRITCAEARRHGIAPVPRNHPAYPFMHDGDGDGVVCE